MPRLAKYEAKHAILCCILVCSLDITLRFAVDNWGGRGQGNTNIFLFYYYISYFCFHFTWQTSLETSFEEKGGLL